MEISAKKTDYLDVIWENRFIEARMEFIKAYSGWIESKSLNLGASIIDHKWKQYCLARDFWVTLGHA